MNINVRAGLSNLNFNELHGKLLANDKRFALREGRFGLTAKGEVVLMSGLKCLFHPDWAQRGRYCLERLATMTEKPVPRESSNCLCIPGLLGPKLTDVMKLAEQLQLIERTGTGRHEPASSNAAAIEHTYVNQAFQNAVSGDDVVLNVPSHTEAGTHGSAADVKVDLRERLASDAEKLLAQRANYGTKPGWRYPRDVVYCLDGCAEIDTTLLPMHEISIDGKTSLHASMFPSVKQMGAHLRWLAETGNAQVVLAGDADMSQRRLPAYFRDAGVYGSGRTQVATESEETASHTLPDGTQVKSYDLTITVDQGEPVVVKVLHVTNWDDPAVKIMSNADMNALVTMVDEATAKPGAFNVHCAAGIDRTGQFATTYFMKHLPTESASLMEIVRGLKEQHAPKVLARYTQQLDALVDEAMRTGRPIFVSGPEQAKGDGGLRAQPIYENVASVHESQPIYENLKPFV